ncbi:hypothetical protein L208DRAFT_1396109 [Tricholoma matsutake]|nr:hypothetical protein L208DRAFT_1396109 [Tricholoma matsutake 945]
MKFFASLAALAALTAVFAQSLTVNTPSNVQNCVPILLTWSGGAPPYYLFIIPANQPDTQPIVTFPPTSANSLTYLVNIPSGTNVVLSLRDSTGNTVSSAPFLIGGTVTTCSSSGSGSGSGSSTPTTAGATTPSGLSSTGISTLLLTTSTFPATTASRSSTGSGSSSGSSTSRPATTSNAASTQAAQLGAAGLIGAAVIALMA